MTVAEHRGWGDVFLPVGRGARPRGRSVSPWYGAQQHPAHCSLSTGGAGALIGTQFPGPWPCLILCFLLLTFSYMGNK